MVPWVFKALARADPPLRLAQAAEAAPPPYGSAHWLSYGGGEGILLALALLVVAGGFAYAGRRLRTPLRAARPGATVAGFMIAIWLLTLYNVIVAVHVYGLQVREAYPGFVAARVQVGTFIDAPITFFVILYLTRRWGWKVALASGVIGTAAAPMFFELPFDLIVMARTNPPMPPLYRQLFFVPLFLAEFSTVSLLALLPSMRVTARAAYAIAAMFVVFALWAAFGFAFPAEPLPLALNVISKLLCFVAAIMLFVWTDPDIGSPPSPTVC
jgi:hypothetical protein